MLDHISLGVADIDRSAAFYDAALQPLGVTRMMGEAGAFAGYGAEGKLFFFIGARGEAGTPVHIAFTAPDRATVEAFYVAALAAGGRDNGAPGLRPQYSPDYYGAFVRDLDGHNIEAVYRGLL
jgi:catechol 2,3-dioxygenase-like lactoylglutathione lyase family enzyme